VGCIPQNNFLRPWEREKVPEGRMRENPTLSPRRARHNLPALEKPNDDYYLTKTILRSYGYGLHRKPGNFQARHENRPSAPKWARLGVFLVTGASRCLGAGHGESAPLLF
jgi:hypothetical protein